MHPMKAGALTPEELDTLLEDAFVVRDGSAVAELFEADALIAGNGAASARGAGIGPFVARLWAHDVSYLSQPQRVLLAGSTALIVAERATCVLHRAADARWRYAIALLDTDHKETRP